MANQHPPKLPVSFAKQQGVCVAPEALQKLKDKLTVVHPKPVSPHVLAELRRFLGQPFQLEQVDEETFTQCLTKAYEAQASRAQEVMLGMEESMDLDTLVHELPKAQDLLESENDAPIIKLLNAVFTQAIKQNASDIHVETFEQRLLVRFRVDGVLREVLEPPRVLAPLIISRLKVMAKLDIAEKRLPQDGRITLRLAGRLVDVRVSTLPSSHGERVVLRLLDKQTAQLNLSHLGLSETALTTLDGLIHKPHGIILVTGPTGSGKTTTLYAALTVLNETRRNILTIEDPIEYYLEGIGQTQVNPKVDMTFARGLRAILRQDPDVVMIGEIRDLETAEIAVQASLTGHLVLSTLHTNSAIGAITRLRDMGVEPFLLSSTLIGVAAQRLVRVLCTSCKHATPATAEQCQQLGIPLDTKAPATLYEPRGCDDCNQTGFRGRTGIYEIIPVDSTLSAMIHNQASEADMEAHARASVPSIRQDGWRKVLEDVTTIEEVLQVTA